MILTQEFVVNKFRTEIKTNLYKINWNNIATVKS